MQSPPTSLPSEHLLSLRDVATYLGVSLRSIWTFVGDGRLHVLRIGPKTLRVESDELQRFLAAARDAR